MKIIEYEETIQVNDYVIYSDGNGTDQDYISRHLEIIKHYSNSKVNHCPFCRSDISLEHERRPKSDTRHKIWLCGCGWWQHERIYDTRCYTNYAPGLDVIERSAELKHAIVSSYDISSDKTPTETLRSYAQRNPDIIYNIHPVKMEKLVQSVFSDHYACEVIHCGRSHDGGVDLVIVNSDSPTLVQVKRRQDPKHTESVSSIREFLGAIMLNSSKHGIYVTTADHFSKMSQDAKHLALERNLVKQFELVDFRSFIEILNLNHIDSSSPWEEILEEG